MKSSKRCVPSTGVTVNVPVPVLKRSVTVTLLERQIVNRNIDTDSTPVISLQLDVKTNYIDSLRLSITVGPLSIGI